MQEQHACKQMKQVRDLCDQEQQHGTAGVQGKPAGAVQRQQACNQWAMGAALEPKNCLHSAPSSPACDPARSQLQAPPANRSMLSVPWLPTP